MYNPEEKKIITHDEAMLTQVSGWENITTDIEKYFKLKGYLIDSFRSILHHSPHEVKVTIQAIITKMEETETLWSLDDLTGFLKLVQINCSSLLSSLDDKKIPDYAAPYQAVAMLDAFLSKPDGKDYSEENLNSKAAAFTQELFSLGMRFTSIDWKKVGNKTLQNLITRPTIKLVVFFVYLNYQLPVRDSNLDTQDQNLMSYH